MSLVSREDNKSMKNGELIKSFRRVCNLMGGKTVWCGVMGMNNKIIALLQMMAIIRIFVLYGVYCLTNGLK